MPEKGKRIKRKKYPGLTDIKEIKDTTEKRIAKKIFNKLVDISRISIRHTSVLLSNGGLLNSST